MIPLEFIEDQILDDIKSRDDETMRGRVRKLLNLEYFELCFETSWRTLREELDLDFTTVSDSTGLWLPSDLCGIDMVRDDDNDFEFVERNIADVEPDEYAYRFYRYRPNNEPYVYGEDIVLNKGSTTFTSDTLDTQITGGKSVDGLQIRVGAELGFYTIDGDTSPYTISPTYYGPDLTDDVFEVRPKETEKMIIIDPSENILQDRTVRLSYWRQPTPLYRTSDRIELPSAEILKLKVLRDLPEAKPFRPVSETEIEKALSKAVSKNPDFVRKGNPRDKHGNIFAFKTEMYERRRGSG